ncbi:HD domain-containing protein [bacterium]|nr:HD domain-containing protein [candidate division CSSED10-310 bacterium]
MTWKPDDAECRHMLPFNRELTLLHHDLGQYIRQEEAAYVSRHTAPDTLMGHLERVATHAVRLALKEGVDPLQAELAGLFHDAGKFHGGKYHDDEIPEEEYSIDVLRTFGGRAGLDPAVVESVAMAIAQLYQDDVDSTPLSKVLFDADNLDKLGLTGIALYFIKSGLRGHGFSADMIVRLTVELTYARYAEQCLYTQTARNIAEQRASDTIDFIRALLETMREDGLFDACVERVRVCDLDLDVISPSACSCGEVMELKNWIEKGTKCTEIHLELVCKKCSNRYKIRFCRPRLIAS